MIVYEIVNAGHAWAFYRAIESAKIALSDEAKSVIILGRSGVERRGEICPRPR